MKDGYKDSLVGPQGVGQWWLRKEKWDVAITRKGNRNRSGLYRQVHGSLVNWSSYPESNLFVKVCVVGSWERNPEISEFFLPCFGKIWRKRNAKICKLIAAVPVSM